MCFFNRTKVLLYLTHLPLTGFNNQYVIFFYKKTLKQFRTSIDIPCREEPNRLSGYRDLELPTVGRIYILYFSYEMPENVSKTFNF